MTVDVLFYVVQLFDQTGYYSHVIATQVKANARMALVKSIVASTPPFLGAWMTNEFGRVRDITAPPEIKKLMLDKSADGIDADEETRPR